VNRFDAKTEADRSCATKPDNLISYRQALLDFLRLPSARTRSNQPVGLGRLPGAPNRSVSIGDRPPFSLVASDGQPRRLDDHRFAGTPDGDGICGGRPDGRVDRCGIAS
ncbi:hypothetical protein LB579_11585, partial [Mesorhizobium sp. BR1-1-7]|uniref:hypothetical protein n=1 Tax=Mesorhizobium sp. BR1-1-7 TaxID=2876647 RepID=UPI001CC996B0